MPQTSPMSWLKLSMSTITILMMIKLNQNYECKKNMKMKWVVKNFKWKW